MKPTEYHTTSIPMKPPKEYRTVKQPENSSICGACLVAMITGHKLDDVMMMMHHTTRDDHLYYKENEIIRYLATLGIYTGIRAIPLFNPLHPANLIEFTWTFHNNQAILAVKSKVHEDADHWVFWDGKQVRDSSWVCKTETSKLKDYHILEIIPITYSEEWIMPPSGKLHQEDCPCITCATIREHE